MNQGSCVFFDFSKSIIFFPNPSDKYSASGGSGAKVGFSFSHSSIIGFNEVNLGIMP